MSGGKLPTATPGMVAIADLKPSPTNPRKTFEAVEDLAASIRLHGILQPLLVRPVGAPGKPYVFDKRTGQYDCDHFEVVAGGRRLAAAKLAGLTELPVQIRQLTDAEVLELQLVENDQREDVKPTEQAAAYKRLVDAVGLAEAAKRIGKGESTVRGIVLLSRAPAELAKAVDDGHVSRSTAEVVCRVPGERSRAIAAYCVMTGSIYPPSDAQWDSVGDVRANMERGDGPLTQRETKELIARHFTRELKTAPFGRKALYMLPGCEPGHEMSIPTCEGCPKRAGNDPEAKAEGVRGDVCLDPECFEGKVKAHEQVEIEKFAKKWKLDPANVQTVTMSELAPMGWVDIDEPVLESELARDGSGYTNWKKKPKAETTTKDLLLSPDGIPVIQAGTCIPHLGIDLKGKPHTLVKTADVRKNLMRAEIIKKPEKPDRTVTKTVGKAKASESPDGPYLLYRLKLNPDVMPTVEFSANENNTPDYLREQAVSEFMDWFDGIDWTDTNLIRTSFVDYERVPEAEAAPVPVQSPAPGPIVCQPVGNGKLADIPGIDADDAKCLSACGLTTLAGLEQKLEALRSERGRQNATHYDVLRQYPGAFTAGDCTRIGDAITDHLNVGKAVSEAQSAKKGGKRKAGAK